MNSFGKSIYKSDPSALLISLDLFITFPDDGRSINTISINKKRIRLTGRSNMTSSLHDITKIGTL